jgi:hypothetical protein
MILFYNIQNEIIKEIPTKTENKAEEKTETPKPVGGGFGDFMAKQKETKKSTWDCSVCCVSNKIEDAKCCACETPNPNAKSKEAENLPKIDIPAPTGMVDKKTQKEILARRYRCISFT